MGTQMGVRGQREYADAKATLSYIQQVIILNCKSVAQIQYKLVFVRTLQIVIFIRHAMRHTWYSTYDPKIPRYLTQGPHYHQ